MSKLKLETQIKVYKKALSKNSILEDLAEANLKLENMQSYIATGIVFVLGCVIVLLLHWFT
jgi:hypothetical protein